MKIFFFLSICFGSSFTLAIDIFEPNKIPNIKYLPIESELFSEINLNLIKELRKNRLFLLYAYEDFQLEKNISCKKTNPRNHKTQINLIINELKKYRTNFFKLINFNYLVFCENLKINNIFTAGIPNNNVATLLFDLSLKDEKISRSIHHEIFHMIKLDKNYISLNEKYLKFNDQNFLYSKCSICGNKFNTNFNNDLPGFVSEYSMNSINEDQAEVFAAWLTFGKNFNQFFYNDEIIFNKKNILENYFEHFLIYGN